jgi:hypothetical protein
MLLQELIERNRQIADTLSRRVVDRVGDRRRNADDADLANPFDAKRIAIVQLVNKDDFYVLDVCVLARDIRRCWR